MTVEGAINTLANARSTKTSHEPNINQMPTMHPPNNQKRIIQIPMMTKTQAQSAKPQFASASVVVFAADFHNVIEPSVHL
jgi:hypothetical protein